MTKAVSTNEISRREFLKKLTANTAKIAIGAAALSAVSAPQIVASAAAPAPKTTANTAPVKRSTRNFVASFDTTAIWDG